MKVWLDDTRPPPSDDWAWLRDGHAFKLLLMDRAAFALVDEISFDHDIATEDYHGNEITGYTCLCWIEKMQYNDADFRPPLMHVHSANPVGRQKMLKLIERITERWRAIDAR